MPRSNGHPLSNPPVLRGDRIVLRELKPEDITASYLAWLQDPEVLQYLEIRFTKQTRESVEAFVSRLLSDEANILFGIFKAENDRHIGNVKLGPIVWRHLRGEIGIMIGDKSCWGRGLGVEAIQLISRFGFDHLKLHKLTAGCLGPNESSKKAFIKAGFTVEGCRPEYWIWRDGFCDNVLLGKTNPADEVARSQ